LRDAYFSQFYEKPFFKDQMTVKTIQELRKFRFVYFGAQMCRSLCVTLPIDFIFSSKSLNVVLCV
jgi:hypothetical protein